MTLFPVVLVLICVSLGSLPVQGLTAVACFSQNGLAGSITFQQQSLSSPTTITLNFTHLPSGNLPWHVHEFPFRLGSPSPCSSSSVAGHFDPLLANNGSNYSSKCASSPSLCEMGDLSGKHGWLNDSISTALFTDSTLHLHGIYSIIGRSVVIHSGNSRVACANVDYPHSSGFSRSVLYAPFRTAISGDVFILQYTQNMTAVFTDLNLLITTMPASVNHDWHVHIDPVTTEDTCSMALGHYDPRGASTSGSYSQICTPKTPINCEVGDLSAKGGGLDFLNQRGKLFYTDTDLPVTPLNGISIQNRSVVIHGADHAAERIACANLLKFDGRDAVARFTGDEGVTGFIRFFQRTPFDQTVVTVYLTGLGSQGGGYHVHVYPVGSLGQCSSLYTGPHFNPRNVSYTIIAPQTSDQYEIGDLSGKFGVLDNLDTVNFTESDPNIPLYGRDSIIGRSVVIHRQDGSRWVCANIEHNVAVLQASAVFTVGDHTLKMVLTQPADDPFADTTIFIADLPPPQAPISSSVPLDQQSTTSIMDMNTQIPVVTMTLSPVVSIVTPTSAIVTVSSTINMGSSPVISAMVTSSVSSVLSESSPGPVISAMVTSSVSSVLPESSPSPVVSAMMTSSVSSVPTESSPSSSFYSHTSLNLHPTMSTFSSFLSSSSIFAPFSSSFSSPLSSFPSLYSTSASFSITSSPLSVNLTMVPSDQPITSTSTFFSSADFSELFTHSHVSSVMLSSPSITPSMFMEVMEITQSLSFSESLVIATPTPSIQGGLSKREANKESFIQSHVIEKRQTQNSLVLDWTIHHPPVSSVGTADCSTLGVFLPAPSTSDELCKSGNQLACAGGDLTAKHGRLILGEQQGARLVFTDPFLPLSGPNSVISMVLMLQSTDADIYTNIYPGADAQNNTVFTCSRSDTTSTYVLTTSSLLPMSSSSMIPSVEPAGLQLPVIIGICLGATFVVILLIVFIILLAVYFCMRRSSRRNYSLPEKNGKHDMEMGKFTSKPVIGIATYRALHFYSPQNDGDMTLEEGDMVELIEAPYGGGWWRGKVENREGWFPKSYVEYVDLEAERRKKKEEEFQIAAALIKAASDTFSRDVTGKNTSKSPPKSTPKSTPTINRMSVDSTPLLVTKFETHSHEGSIDDLYRGSSLLTSSRPDTPSSIKTGSNIPSSHLASHESPIPDSETCVAKYDYVATVDTELDLKQGDVVVILERADNGWWHGLVGEKHGWFPGSFAEPAPTSSQADTPLLPSEEEPIALGPRRMSEFVAGTSEEVEASEFKAIQTFNGGEEGNLRFDEGDMVLVYWAHDNGWWYGAAGDNQGWFPGSFVEPVVESSEASCVAASPAVDTLPPVEEKAESLALDNELEPTAVDSEEQKTTTPNDMNTRDMKSEMSSSARTEPSQTSETSSSPVIGNLQTEIQSILGRLGSKSDLQKKTTDQNSSNTSSSDYKTSSKPLHGEQTAPSPQTIATKPVIDKPHPSVTSEMINSSPKPAETGRSLVSDKEYPEDGKITPTQGKYRRRAPPPPRPITKKSPNIEMRRSPKPHRVAPPTPPSKSPTQSSHTISPSPLPSTPRLAMPSPIPKSTSPIPAPVAKHSPTPPPSSPVKVDSPKPSTHKPTTPVVPLTSQTKPQRLTTADSKTRKRRPPPMPPGMKKNIQTKLSLSKDEVDGSPAPSRPPPLAPVPAPRQRPPVPKARVQMIKRPQTRNIPPPPAIPLPPPPKREIPPPPASKPPQLSPVFSVNKKVRQQSPLTTRELDSERSSKVITNEVSLPKQPSETDLPIPHKTDSQAPVVPVKPAIKPKPALLPKPKRLSQSLVNTPSATTLADQKNTSDELSKPKSLLVTTGESSTAAGTSATMQSKPNKSADLPTPAKRTTVKALAPQSLDTEQEDITKTSTGSLNNQGNKHLPPRPKPPSRINEPKEETDNGTVEKKEASKPPRPSNPPPFVSSDKNNKPARPNPAPRTQATSSLSDDKAANTSGKSSSRRPPPARPPPPKLATTTSASPPKAEAVTKKEVSPEPSSPSSITSSLSSKSTRFYKASQNCYPEQDGYLKFTSGDILVYIDRSTDKEGYLYGMTDDGATGLFPLTHVIPFET